MLEYIIVTGKLDRAYERARPPEQLALEVNRKIREGFVPHGDVFIWKRRLYQPMTRQIEEPPSTGTQSG